MKQYPGVTIAYRKDGTPVYRASVTFHRKHISLGSFRAPEEGSAAYWEAAALLDAAVPAPAVDAYRPDSALSFSKYVSLVNLKTNGIYIKNPIYLYPDYFLYYLSPDMGLKFDRDDLFFYSAHAIQQRGGYLFVCHYGSQYGILSRYGVRRFAVEGRDYLFMNGDRLDYRYQNIRVLNHYMGVTQTRRGAKTVYTASIHINGICRIGRYATEEDAAIAYNKAADYLADCGFSRRYIRNYIVGLSAEAYAARYQTLSISERLSDALPPRSS